jgi:hypothetical protein
MSAPSKPRSWSVEGWAAFWSAPSLEVAKARVPTVCAPNITGYWPRQKPLHGLTDYCQRIFDLIEFVPDLRLKLEEHATNGEFTFLRWSARGTGPDGAFEINGVDRVRVRNGLVIENRIISDGEVFDHFARRVGAARAAAA